jgi:hypothetical protein
MSFPFNTSSYPEFSETLTSEMRPPEKSGQKKDSYPEYVETESAFLCIKRDQLLEIRFKEQVAEINSNHLAEIKTAYRVLTENENVSYHILVIPAVHTNIAREALEKEIVGKKICSDLLSLSIVVYELHQRLLAISLAKKMNCPFKLFRSETQAQKWIPQRDK